jgi:hypothetical protein
VTVALLLALSLGCGAAPAPRLSPGELALAQAGRRVTAAWQRALLTQTDTRQLQTWLRWNPAPCTCPAWELAFFDQWVRVEVIAARDAEDTVAPVLDAGDHPLGLRRWLRGSVTGDVVRRTDGWAWSVVAARGLDPSPPPASPPAPDAPP